MRTEPRLLVVRHGETPYNVEPERIRGWLDPPLTIKGKTEATRLAKEIAPMHPAQVYTSDLKRARDTATAIAQAAKLKPPTPLRGLRPWNLGDWQGKPVEDHEADMVEAVRYSTRKVPGGEAFATFVGRYTSVLKAIASKAIAQNSTIVIVTHLRNTLVTDALVESEDQAGPPRYGALPSSFVYEPQEEVAEPCDYLDLRYTNGAWHESK